MEIRNALSNAFGDRSHPRKAGFERGAFPDPQSVGGARPFPALSATGRAPDRRAEGGPLRAWRDIPVRSLRRVPLRRSLLALRTRRRGLSRLGERFPRLRRFGPVSGNGRTRRAPCAARTRRKRKLADRADHPIHL